MTWYGLDHRYILNLIASDPETYAGTGIVPGVSDMSLADPGKAMLALAEGGIRAFRVRGGKTGRPTAFGRLDRWLDYPGYEAMFRTGAGTLTGVRALFLYPLNALINSQRDRLRAWCNGFGNDIRFCLYNGETQEKVPAHEQTQAGAEQIVRPRGRPRRNRRVARNRPSGAASARTRCLVQSQRPNRRQHAVL